MVTGRMSYYMILRVLVEADLKGKDDEVLNPNPILESDIWIKKEAETKALAWGKKLKCDCLVIQAKQIFATDTGEAKIVF